MVIQNTETVLKIFQSMNVAEEPVDTNFAKKWIDMHFSDSKPTDRLSKFFYTRDNVLEKLEVAQLISCILKFISVLEEREDDFVSMLVLLKHTWHNAKLVMSAFANSLKACCIVLQNNPNYFANSIYFISPNELSTDAKFIANSISSNSFIIKKCLKSDPLLPFYFFLSDICCECGLKGRILVDVTDNHSEGDPQRSGSSMVITESSDMDSAIDSFCKSVREYPVEPSNAVSHIFIEEIIYAATVQLLKNRLEKLIFGDRTNRATDIELMLSETPVGPHASGFEVFSPVSYTGCLSRSPIRLCLNFNPCDIDEGDRLNISNGFITVLPYRNIMELETLIKENGRIARPGSLWSEKLWTKNMRSKLQFSTTWVNCHGLDHPLLPTCHYPSTAELMITYEKSLNSIKYSKEDILSFEDCEVSLNKAVKGFLDWKKCSITQKFETLKRLNLESNLLEDNPSHHKCSCWLYCAENHLKLYIDNIIKSPTTQYEFSFSLSPVGIININLNCYYSVDLIEKLRHLIAVALYHGNCIIVSAVDQNLLLQCEAGLQQFLSTCFCSNLVSFYNSTENEAFQKFINKMSNPLLRVINVREQSLSYIHNSASIYLSLTATYWNNRCFLSVLTTLQKTVWF